MTLNDTTELEQVRCKIQTIELILKRDENTENTHPTLYSVLKEIADGNIAELRKKEAYLSR